MSFLLISVANRLGCKSVNVDNILTYKKIFVLALRKRRALLLGVAVVIMSAATAYAADRLPYDAAAFQAAFEAGKPILVHVTAPWCGECKLQKPIVARLAERSEFKDLTIFDVDFDAQKEALRRLKVAKQSTLLVFKGKAEITRSVGVTRSEAIEALMKKAL